MVVMAVVVVQALRMARDVDVAAVADHAVHVQHEVVAADAVETEHAGALVVAAGRAQLGAAAQRLVGEVARDAAVDHVHRTTDRTTAVEKVGRALEHLDLVRQERLDADGMVGADGGGIHAADATGQHLHARAFLAADDRPADAGAKGPVLHAGQRGHRFAEAARLAVVQRLAVQHLDRMGEVLGITTQRHGGHLHGIERGGRRVGTALRVCAGTEGQRDGQGKGEAGGGRAGRIDHGPWVRLGNGTGML